MRAVKYSDKAARLSVMQHNKEVLSYDLNAFCNHDNACNNKETFLSCSDCKAYERDGYCNYKPGKAQCDPDCPDNVDYDCRDAAKTIEMIYGKEVKIDGQNKGDQSGIAPKYDWVIIVIVIIVMIVLAAGIYFMRRRSRATFISQGSQTSIVRG